MFRAFFRYFIFYLFRAKTRQKLLFLAFVGLMLSSFSLIVVQSTMGGLQKNVIDRSERIFGTGEVFFHRGIHVDDAREISDRLSQEGIEHNLEYRLELLMRRSQHLAPAIVTGVYSQTPPDFLDPNTFDEAIVGAELLSKLGGAIGDSVQIISPAHVNPVFRDVPRSTTVYVDNVLRTNVPEVDGFQAWVDINKVHNLIRERSINRFRVISEFEVKKVTDIFSHSFSPDEFRVHSWADAHQTLVWALGLETSVMVFLFIAMTILVSLCIVSGLLLFFDKVQLDLSSFWILGASKKALEKSMTYFFVFLAFFSILLGLGLGLVFLLTLEVYGFEILPVVFVDRKIPVDITFQGLSISFFIPLLIAFSFMFWVLRNFKGKVDYLDRVRSVG